MKPGDLIRYERMEDMVGILLEIRNYQRTVNKYTPSSQMLYSFKVLDNNGEIHWYDVWNDGDSFPQVVE